MHATLNHVTPTVITVRIAVGVRIVVTIAVIVIRSVEAERQSVPEVAIMKIAVVETTDRGLHANPSRGETVAHKRGAVGRHPVIGYRERGREIRCACAGGGIDAALECIAAAAAQSLRKAPIGAAAAERKAHHRVGRDAVVQARGKAGGARACKPKPKTRRSGHHSEGGLGSAGAVANAVWHATGIRVRRFPIKIEDLVS